MLLTFLVNNTQNTQSCLGLTPITSTELYTIATLVSHHNNPIVSRKRVNYVN